jgi:hypothetical protein
MNDELESDEIHARLLFPETESRIGLSGHFIRYHSRRHLMIQQVAYRSVETYA